MATQSTAERAELMGSEKITKLLLQFAGPAILMMLVSSLYNIVDKIFVGQFMGDAGLAGATMVGPVMRIITAVAILIGAGGNALLALRLGEGRHEEAETILNNSFLLAGCLSILLTAAAQVFARPILLAFGCDEPTMVYALPYLRIVAMTAFFETMTSGMGLFIRTDGKPRYMMLCSITGCLVNIVLDPVLIAVAHLGIHGAAIATAFSQFISGVLVLCYFTVSRSSTIRLRPKLMRLNLAVTWTSVKLGFSSFLQQFLGGISQSILYACLSRYAGGKDAVSYSVAVASVGVTTGVGLLFVLPVLGLQTAIQPIIGYNYGAKKYDRVLKTLWSGIGLAIGLSCIGWIVILVFAEPLALVFGAEDYLTHAAWTMRVYNITLPLMALSALGSNFYQSIGKPTHAVLLGMSRQVLCLIPACLILPLFLGQKGVIWAIPVADVVSFTLSLVMLLHESKRMRSQSARLAV